MVLILDTFKYPGFVGKHFFIDAKVYFALTLVIVLFSASKSGILDLIIKINRILLILFSIVYLGLAAFEGAHYTNYILTIFRIHLDGMIILILFSFLLFLADRFKSLLPKKINQLGVIYPAMILLIVYFIVKNLSYISDQAVNRDFYVFFHPKASYDEKMFYQWGDFYRFMVFVKNNTTPTASIVISPMIDPWLQGSGNVHFVRAFLFPRRIIQYQNDVIPVESLEKGTFLLISWGSQDCKPDPVCHGWPRQTIKAAEIIYKNPNSDKVVEVKENSVYTLEDDRYVYGLIKL